LLNHVSSSENTCTVTKQVGSGLTCVQHFVEISAGIQTAVTEIFHIFQLVAHHPAIRCCSIISRYCPSICLRMTRLGIEESQKRLSTKVRFSLCATSWALCNQGVYIHVFLTRAVGGEWWALHLGAHWGGWMGPRASLGDMEKWKLPDSAGTQNPTPVTQPVGSHYPGSPRLCSEYILSFFELLWSEFRVRFLALPDFLSSGSGTGSTQQLHHAAQVAPSIC
jgi:hypothetical protein